VAGIFTQQAGELLDGQSAGITFNIKWLEQAQAMSERLNAELKVMQAVEQAERG